MKKIGKTHTAGRIGEGYFFRGSDFYVFVFYSLLLYCIDPYNTFFASWNRTVKTVDQGSRPRQNPNEPQYLGPGPLLMWSFAHASIWSKSPRFFEPKLPTVLLRMNPMDSDYLSVGFKFTGNHLSCKGKKILWFPVSGEKKTSPKNQPKKKLRFAQQVPDFSPTSPRL